MIQLKINYSIKNSWLRYIESIDNTDIYIRNSFNNITFEHGEEQIRRYDINKKDITVEVRLSLLDEEHVYFIKSVISSNFYYLIKVF